MERLIEFDTTVFRWINGHHNDMLDWLLWTVSQHWCWVVVIVAVYLLVTLRRDRRSWAWVLLGIALCFLLADQISNNVIKDGVQRLRPCWGLEDVRMFHTSKGGQYGFVSSHASNVFALAMFFSLLYGGKRRRGQQDKGGGDSTEPYRAAWLPWVLMAWACLVGYSRCYLGKHYPGDVVCGAFLGLGVGALVYFVISRIRRLIASRSSV